MQRMRKRFIALITAFLVVICTLPSVAKAAETADNEFSEEIAVLAALNIYSTEIDEDFGVDPDEAVKAGEFLGAVLKMRLNDIDENAELTGLAVQCGIIDNSAAIEPSERITLNEALKIILNAMDYKMLARAKGGYPTGYIKLANEVGLLSGLKASGSEQITLGTMLKLLSNAIDAPAAQIDVFGQNEYSFKTTEGITALSVYRDIYKIRGRVNENSYTALSDVSHLKNGEVRIDNTVYKSGNTAAEEYIGKEVEAYVQGGKNVIKPEIVYISDYNCNNSEITLDAEDITDLSDGFTELKYQREGERERSAVLSPVRRVIYNGVLYDDFTREDIMVEEGAVRLLDNDGDGIYDIVFVDCFNTTIFVNYISTYDRLIYSQYSNSSAVSFEELYRESGDDENLILLGGEKIKLSDIKKNDVVCVSKSKNPSKKLAKVYVTRQSITGMLKSVNAARREISVVTENGTEKYKLGKVFIDEQKEAKSKFPELTAGNEYVFYLNAQGKVAAAISEEDAGWQYILILGMGKEKGLGTNVDVKFLNSSGAWVKASLSKKMEYQNEPKTAAEVFSALAGGGRCTPQVAYAKLDSSGNIKKLRTGVVSDEQNKNLLTQTVEKQRIYRPSNSFDYTLFLEDGATVFVMPSSVSYEEDDYYVAGNGYFSTNWPYMVTAYNTDKYGFCNVVSVKDDSGSQNLDAKNMFLVTDITEELNGNGDVVKKIYGSTGNYTIISAEGADGAIFSGIESGDIIQAATDMRGRINRLKKVYSISEGKKSSKPSNYIVDDLTFSGTVSEIDAENGRMLLRYNDSSVQPVKIFQSTPVTVYEEKTQQATKVKTANIKKGDFVVIRMSHVVVQDIIIIRFDEA